MIMVVMVVVVMVMMVVVARPGPLTALVGGPALQLSARQQS